LFEKKKVRGDREKLIRCVLLFRVFEQKEKARVPVFEPRSGITRHRHTSTHRAQKKKAHNNYNNNNNTQ
jgi:hypothetical protein